MAVHRGAAARPSVDRRARRARAARPRRRQGAHRRQQRACGCRSKDLTPAEQAKVTAALAKYAGIDAAEVSVTNVGPTWGDKVSSKALSALDRVLLRDRALPHVPLRVAHGARRDHRGDPRHHHHRRRVRGHRVRGDAGDGRRVPHHPRVLALRHRRRVRQGQGEPGAPRHRPRRHLLDDGEPVAEPGADAVDQHVVRRAAPGGVAAVRRHLRVRRARAARLRARAVRRPAHRCLLVDLRGHADPRVAEGARAASTARCASARPPTWPRRSAVAPVAPGRRRPRRSTCPSTARTSNRSTTTSTTPATTTARTSRPTAPAAPAAPRRRHAGRHRGRAPPSTVARAPPTRAVASSDAASAADASRP